MKRALLFAVTVWCAVLATAAAAQDTRIACKQGVRSGTAVFWFCGAARATFTIGGRIYRVSSGRCQMFDRGAFFGVNIGATSPFSTKPKYAYFGAEVRPPQAGVHLGQLIAIALPDGLRYSLRGAVTLKQSLHAGTFFAALRGGGITIGSFAC